MAIVGNTASEIGDVLYIQNTAPAIGITAINSFTDVVGGETAGRFWTKTFRYSLDGGLNWSEWIDLTNPNLVAIPIQREDIFITEYRYTRDGTDPSDLLSFTSVDLNTNSNPIDGGITFENSIFRDFFQFDDVGVLNWAINVMAKIYNQGIVPKYIIRGEGGNAVRPDEDYIDYWFSVCHFFAFFVRYAREFQNFYSDNRLIRDYLKQKDLFTCDTDGLVAMNEVMNNMLREMRRRGGIEMYETAVQSGRSANGELLRLLCWDADTEFILGVATQECATWNLDNTSPSYNGVGGCLHLVKGYEWTRDVVDTAIYPLVAPSGSNVITTTGGPDYIGGNVDAMRISGVAAGNSTGIGNQAENPSKSIVVDPNLNYEITFSVKVDTIANTALTFGCLAWNAANGVVQLSGMDDGVDDTYFFQEVELNIVGEWYFVRGIIFNQNEPNSGEPTSLGVGKHLRFKSSVVKIMPIIQLDNTNGIGASGAMDLWDIKIKPASLNYSHSYLDQGRWIDAVIKNKNGELSDAKLNEVMRRKFIPYNTSFHNIYL